MKMRRILIQVPAPLKAKLDGLRAQGYTASGYIRELLEQDLTAREAAGRMSPRTPTKGR